MASDTRPTFVDPASTPPVRRYRPRSWGRLSLVAAAVLAAAGIAIATVLVRDDSPSQRAATPAKKTVTSAGTGQRTTTTTPAATPRTAQSDGKNGAALNYAGFTRMRAGDYASALPLLERSRCPAQLGIPLAEAYASYNLAFTRRSLGRCDGVLRGCSTALRRSRGRARRSIGSGVSPQPACGSGAAGERDQRKRG